jgi:hypothetical protein
VSTNRGLNLMFTFMNTARIGTAIQGLAHAELSYQGALEYAKERLAMRSLTGPKNPDGPADPIIVHPDVRRMLLTQKAIAEGSRALLYYLAQLGDIVDRGDEERAKAADDLMALLTPIAKAFVTEAGYEAANHGVQIYGGHGFIREWGMEQIVRDARIAMLYEGTTGIQALDLLGRKVLGSGGKLLMGFTEVMGRYIEEHSDEAVKEFIEPLKWYKDEWLTVSLQIGEKAMENADEAGAAAVDYLMYSGYVVLAYFWARMAVVAQAQDRRRRGRQQFLRGQAAHGALLLRAPAAARRVAPRGVPVRRRQPDGHARGDVRFLTPVWGQLSCFRASGPRGTALRVVSSDGRGQGRHGWQPAEARGPGAGGRVSQAWRELGRAQTVPPAAADDHAGRGGHAAEPAEPGPGAVGGGLLRTQRRHPLPPGKQQEPRGQVELTGLVEVEYHLVEGQARHHHEQYRDARYKQAFDRKYGHAQASIQVPEVRRMQVAQGDRVADGGNHEQGQGTSALVHTPDVMNVQLVLNIDASQRFRRRQA